jgi:hypothetical protein
VLSLIFLLLCHLPSDICNLLVPGHAMSHAVSHRPLTAEAWVSQSMWNLWWTKWHSDRLFSKFFGFPLSISFCRIFSYSCNLGDERKACRWPQFRDIVLPHQHEPEQFVLTPTIISWMIIPFFCFVLFCFVVNKTTY